MKINLNFLITDGKNLILSNTTTMPPSLLCEKNIANNIKAYLENEFMITQQWSESIKFISYVEHNGFLELFHGILVPETFKLKSEYYWENISTLKNVITDERLFLLILSFLNAI